MTRDQWCSLAYFAAKKIVRYSKKPFLAENLLAKVIDQVGEPVDARSFGTVICELRDDRVIEKVGYAAAKSSNYSQKVKWQRARK